MPGKKIAIIGTAGIPAGWGEREILAEQLAKHLGDMYDMTVYCSKKKFRKKTRPKNYYGVRLKYLPFNTNGIQGFIYNGFSICHALLHADALLILAVEGAWMLPFIKFFTRKKVIVSIDDVQWQKNKLNWFAKRYLCWAKKMTASYSIVNIPHKKYDARPYCNIISTSNFDYGADHTISVKPTAADKEAYTFIAKPYAFKSCSIEPGNNIHIVLEAFSRMTKYTLVVSGNWENSNYGRSLRKQYKNFNNLVLLDTVYDPRNRNLLRGNAYIYLHGIRGVAANHSLVEAMYLGLPVIAFDAPYNRITTEEKAFYFSHVNDLVSIIESTRISEFKENGLLMKEIAERMYSWDVIAGNYDRLFKRVLNNSITTPGTVYQTALPEKALTGYKPGHLKSAPVLSDKNGG